MNVLLVALAMMRPVPLHVVGNQLLEDGRVVMLGGVNLPGFESSDEGEFVFRSGRVALEDWHANCIRLPLCEDRWFGKADKQKDKGEGYRESVNEVVNLAVNRGAFIILDLHWSDANVWGANLGKHQMPDEHSLQFWRDLAVKFRGLPHVLFGLYSEPHDVSWEVWKNGGDVQENELNYHAPGMQTLLDAIRKQGAKNVCVVGGLDHAYDLTGISKGFALKDDAGNGVVYDAHLYPAKGDWDEKVAGVCATSPVLIGECGCLPSDPESPEPYVSKLFRFIGAHSLHWAAWGMSPSTKPNLISDWVYAPTPFWGVTVRSELAKSAGGRSGRVAE